MQDVTSYVNNASPLSVAVNGGESKKTTSEKTSTKSFISIMLSQLSEGASSSKVNTKTTKEISSENAEELKSTAKEAKKAKSVDEHLLEDLLKIVNALKNGATPTSFPTLKATTRLDKVLNNETALKELGEVKSLSDLLALSKKYDLGLEKISFSKESLEKIQKEFPQLAKSDFFKNIEKEVPIEERKVEAKTATASINPLENQVKKSENTTQPSALKDLMSKEDTSKAKEVIVKVETQEVKVETQEVKVETQEVKVETKTEASVKKVEVKEMLKVEVAEEPKVMMEKQIIKEVKIAETLATESKKTTPTPVEIVAQKASIVTAEESKIDKKVKAETAPIIASKESEVEIKAPLVTRISEQKVENHSSSKGLVETILQSIKVEKPVVEQQPEENALLVPATILPHEENIKSETTEAKPSTIEVKSVQKQEATIKQPISSRESLNQFASDLREKIENYKPPVMKVELALNPKNLGEVDVTLLTRGNNLHVNISSNSTTMTLFTQNQAEFKNALINMGFTNLEMNFSDQQKNQQQQQQNNQQKNNQFFDELAGETSNETATTLEVVIPQYV